jgi:hypothetical protein
MVQVIRGEGGGGGRKERLGQTYCAVMAANEANCRRRDRRMERRRRRRKRKKKRRTRAPFIFLIPGFSWIPVVDQSGGTLGGILGSGTVPVQVVHWGFFLSSCLKFVCREMSLYTLLSVDNGCL